MIEKVTFVVIGKNEAINLPRCFSSILKISDNIIFVDSDSDDNSVSIAKEYNVKKVFRVKANHGTPALSRSIGANEVKTEYIQFLDGDMTIEEGWIQIALKKLDKNKNIAAVHGFKRVFTKNDHDYFILSDSKDWEADYLQGAFLIKRDIFNMAGGLDGRFYGEEERDLYVRIKSRGYQVWYLHYLMASHYDFKVKKIRRILYSDSGGTIWIPLVKAIKEKNLKSYLFVYRALLPPALLDALTIVSIIFGPLKFILFAITLQSIELFYCFLIKRKGYFIIWKVGLINIWRAIKIYKRNITYKVETL